MIILKSRQEIEKIRKASLVVAEVLEKVGAMIRPGIATQALDEFAEKIIVSAGAKPAFKGYRGYPKTLCTSLNEQVVHGIPSKDVILKEGDIISVDVGAIVEGFYGDAAKTFPVGKVKPEAERLIRVTEEALSKGIAEAVPENRLYDISSAVQRHVESNGYSVVREFVGHGIGRNMHEDPQIPNFGEQGQGPRIKAGHDIRHRADGQPGRQRNDGEGGRLDGGYAGWKSFCAFRAYHSSDAGGAVDSDAKIIDIGDL